MKCAFRECLHNAMGCSEIGGYCIRHAKIIVEFFYRSGSSGWEKSMKLIKQYLEEHPDEALEL